MEKIPTAEEFFEQGGTYPELAIEFAKLHVRAALKAASEEADTKEEQVYNGSMGDENGNLYSSQITIDKESILNAYPLENIK